MNLFIFLGLVLITILVFTAIAVGIVLGLEALAEDKPGTFLLYIFGNVVIIIFFALFLNVIFDDNRDSIRTYDQVCEEDFGGHISSSDGMDLCIVKVK